MYSGVIQQHRRWVIIFLGVTVAFLAHALTPISAAPPTQAPLVVDASDDDSENKLWNCEINRVPFDNQETDRSRCFTFRYTVPPEGISSATVHIALDTLGSLQDTDATIVAVAAPVENCAWGVGSMPGCVMLHGGFQGGEKSLNLNLLNIACDPSIPNTAEAQQLVLDALDTGVLHMLLQDDTSVYSAQLVLNGGAPSFTCGTSPIEVTTFIPTPGPAPAIPTTQGVFHTGLDQIFDPPQYIIHATGHGTVNGAVADDWYFLFDDPPDADGSLELPDDVGGTLTYTTDYSDGPFNNPRDLCAAAGARVGETPLQAWNGGDAFRCNTGGVPVVQPSTSAPESANPIAQFLISREVNQLLTGTPFPTPPNREGATTAVVAGAIALSLFAAANYLISSGGFIKSATANASRAAHSGAQTDSSAAARAAPRDAAGDAYTSAASATPPSREAAASSPSGMGTGGAAAATGTGGMSGDAAPGTAPDLRATGGAGIGAEGAANTGDPNAELINQVVQEGISSVPDAKELVQDQLLGQVEKRDKRERLLAEQARLAEVIKTREQRVAASRRALEAQEASGGDAAPHLRARNRAEAELVQAKDEFKAVVKELAALDEKKEDKK